MASGRREQEVEPPARHALSRFQKQTEEKGRGVQSQRCSEAGTWQGEAESLHDQSVSKTQGLPVTGEV